MLPESLRRAPLVRRLLLLASWLQAWWYDKKHRVQTRGDIPLTQLTVRGDIHSGNFYVPVHPRTAAAVLRDLPITDPREYTFIDLGSGKGRMLLSASEYPFREIVGVEFASELHDIAVKNIRTYRNPKQQCRNIRSVNLDAAAYEFPRENLIVYMFNPFRAELMKKITDRLDRSLDEYPRDVVFVMVNPELGRLVDGMQNVKLWKTTPYYSIYRSKVQAAISSR